MYDCPLSNVPLPSRLGTQLFELKPSLDPFAEDEHDQHPVGHILFDPANNALVIGDTKVPNADVMYCDITDTVCWLASGAQLCEGRLSFTSDCREAIGTVTRRNGEQLVVTGSAMLPSGNGDVAPPAYGADLMSTVIASNISGFGPAGSPFMMSAATTGDSAGSAGEKEEDIYITEFKTERRKQGSTDEDDWSPWRSLEWGMETKTSGTPVVCYVDDVDITDSTTLEHGNKETVIVKTEGDPKNKRLDYTFRIVLDDLVEEKDQKFTGVWVQNEKEWEWRGTFRATKKRTRTSSAGPNLGPDGRSVTQLMSVTSLKPTTKEVVVEVEQPDGTIKPEKKIMTEDMAQEEADRIFARIILHSAPKDVIEALNPDIKPLDAQEQKIVNMGPNLTATATFAMMDDIMWSSELASNITEFFEDLDVIEKDEKSGKETVFTKMGKASDEAMREKAADWVKLRAFLADRDDLTWSEFGKALVAGFDGHAKQLNRVPSVAELTTVISRNEATGGFWPKVWQKAKAAFKKAYRGVLVIAGASFITEKLVEGQDTLDVAEKVSMYASLVDAAARMLDGVTAPWLAMIKTKPAKFVGRALVSIAKGLGNGIRKLLPRRALQWITAAAKWAKNVVSKITNSVEGATTAMRGFFTRNWARIAKGISLAFGFFVSVSTLVASAFEFDKALKDPKATTVDKVFAGTQLLFAALSTIAFAVEIVASIAHATTIAAIAGPVGIWLACMGIAVAVIALIYTLVRSHEDPINKIIDEYGPIYKLLKY